jgi:DnaJ-class molecular chaperone
MVTGEGHLSASGRRDDVAVVVEYRRDRRLERHGIDLYTRVTVAQRVFHQGGRVRVRGPSGPLEVSVAAGLREGTVLRLRGGGLPGRPERGSLYVELRRRARRRPQTP